MTPGANKHPVLIGVVSVHKEEAWDIRVVVDSALRERCTRQFARSARKSVKFRLNPGMIVRYTAGIVIQSARTKAVKRRDEDRGFLFVKPERDPVSFLAFYR
jgi:hypothetical protein